MTWTLISVTAFMPFRIWCALVNMDLLWLKTASILYYMSSTTNETWENPGERVWEREWLVVERRVQRDRWVQFDVVEFNWGSVCTCIVAFVCIRFIVLSFNMCMGLGSRWFGQFGRPACPVRPLGVMGQRSHPPRSITDASGWLGRTPPRPSRTIRQADTWLVMGAMLLDWFQ